MVKCIPGVWVIMVCVAVCGVALTITPTSAQNSSINTITISPILSALLDAMESMPISQNQGIRNKFDDKQRSSKVNDCKLVNTSDTRSGLQGIIKLKKYSTTFFLRPRTSFKRLLIKMRLAYMLDSSEQFYADEIVELFSSDLGALKEWKQVTVEYYEHSVRGPNKHALRVLVGNTNLNLTSDYRWLLYDYEGFAIHAEGGAEFLFNCQPDLLHNSQKVSTRSAGVWLMVGLLIVATLLLTTLITVWLSLKCKEKRKLRESVPENPVYEEFDEEVLRNLHQKMKALREKKGDVCVITYDAPRAENAYVTIDFKQKQAETDDVYYENPYSLEETQQNQTEIGDVYYENPYSLEEAQQNKAETDDHIYECPYALIEARQKEVKADYQNVYSTRPHFLARR